MSDFTKSHISKSDDWRTPKAVYDALDAEFHFNDDPCPLGGISVGDGLLRDWGTVVFMNPPYSKPGPWCEKALMESRKGKIVVGLLRDDRSTAWYWNYVHGKAEERPIRGRLRFGDSGKPAPFASVVVIWRGESTT